MGLYPLSFANYTPFLKRCFIPLHAQYHYPLHENATLIFPFRLSSPPFPSRISRSLFRDMRLIVSNQMMRVNALNINARRCNPAIIHDVDSYRCILSRSQPSDPGSNLRLALTAPRAALREGDRWSTSDWPMASETILKRNRSISTVRSTRCCPATVAA